MLNTADVAESCKEVSNSGSGNEIIYCSFHLYYVILYYFKTKTTIWIQMRLWNLIQILALVIVLLGILIFITRKYGIDKH